MSIDAFATIIENTLVTAILNRCKSTGSDYDTDLASQPLSLTNAYGGVDLAGEQNQRGPIITVQMIEETPIDIEGGGGGYTTENLYYTFSIEGVSAPYASTNLGDRVIPNRQMASFAESVHVLMSALDASNMPAHNTFKRQMSLTGKPEFVGATRVQQLSGEAKTAYFLQQWRWKVNQVSQQ